MILQAYCGEEKFHMVNVLNLLMMTYAIAGFKDDWDKKLNRKGKQVFFYDENLSSKVKSKFEMDLDKFLIPNNKSHVYLVT
uniref:Uncharacterized protein n=1 Tax=Helianthus annuus TaxID=4232 RepID=A0A251RTB0_HELAN